LKTIVSIQYLRAIAATSVAYHHIFENRNGAELTRYAFGIWGVDVFFVISGFIMWVTTADTNSDMASFWKNRIVRIYPIYWIALTLWILARLVIPDRLANADLTVHNVMMSYLLMPHYHAVFTEHIWPVLVPGWTLQFELFFYFIFGLMLLCTNAVGRVILVGGSLICLSVVGALVDVEDAVLVVYTNPMLLEFGAGVLLGWAYMNKVILPSWGAGAAIILGFAGVILGETYATNDLMRVLVLGAPSFLLISGSVSLERQIARAPSVLLVELGNASYSVYLFHPFAIGFVAIVWERLMPSLSKSIFVLAALLSSAVVGWIAHKLIESPLIVLFKSRRRAV
jgi:exopolysaccharide production protein ExoZ